MPSKKENGELGKLGLAEGEFDGADKPADGEMGRGDRPPLDGELKRDADLSDHERGEGVRAKISERDANNSKLAGMSVAVSSFSATGKAGMSDSAASSLISSEFSLTAKLNGPIGMAVELSPALSELNGKVSVNDRFNSIEPDRSKVTDSAIPSISLEKKFKNVEKLEETKSEKKNCSQSKNCLH